MIFWLINTFNKIIVDITSFNRNTNQRSDISSLYVMKYIVWNKQSKISFEIYEKKPEFFILLNLTYSYIEMLLRD